jgi:PAS domain S-box-containing protein
MMIKDQNKYNILIVEDNPGDLVLIKDYLWEQIEEPHILHSKNYSEAAAIISFGKPVFDVILLDLSLPDKSGQNLVIDILKIAGSVPVIILTGYTGINFSVKSISMGVSDYLIKDDLNPTSLYKSITYCIERKKSISLLKESEKRYSDLFRLNPQPMWVYDPSNYKFTQVNKAAIDHYGYSEEEFLSMNIMDIRPKQYYAEVMAAGAKDYPGEIFKGKFIHFKKSGEAIEVEIFSNFVMINNKEFKLVIANDITEKTLIEHQITRAIIKTQEDERYEIGAELHDNVCQILATSRISLGMLKESLDPAALQLFTQCREYIDLAIDEIRNLSHRLAPAFFNDSTLEQAFEILLSTFNIEEKYKTTLYFDKALAKLDIDRELQLNLYRILQEQLRNILKYAQGTKIEVDVILNKDRLKMRIADDGIGFNKNMIKKGIGLANMKRRTELFFGKLEVFTSPGNGCEILIDIPLTGQENKSLIYY